VGAESDDRKGWNGAQIALPVQQLDTRSGLETDGTQNIHRPLERKKILVKNGYLPGEQHSGAFCHDCD
jgi:hypothetical protein